MTFLKAILFVQLLIVLISVYANYYIKYVSVYLKGILCILIDWTNRGNVFNITYN